MLANQIMPYYLYILHSKKNGKLYIGQTKDLNRRLTYHNNGYSKSTKLARPWEILYTEAFSTRSEAVKKERYFKKLKSPEYIKQIILASI